MADGRAFDRDGGQIIALPERLDLCAAGRLRDQFLSITGDIELDASAVTVATTPAFQVLMAARDRQAASGHALRVAQASEAFRACALTLGLPLSRLQCRGATA